MTRRTTATVLAMAMCVTGSRAARAEKNDMKMKMHDKGSVMKMIEGWPAMPREMAMKLMDKHGAPSGVTPTMLVWDGPAPFKKTILSSTETPHAWPMPHTDFLESVIDYKAPWDKFDELAQFDGSVSAVRTLGTLSARCDTVEHNILGLNLANDVAMGKKTPEEARKAFEQAAMAEKKGEKPAILQRLMFEPMKMGTGDPDKSASMK